MIKTLKAREHYSRLAYLFPCVMAFLLPFNVGVAVVSAAWLLAFLFLGNLKTAMPGVFTNGWFYPPFIFFLLHVLAYAYTSNKPEASFSIEIKLSFLIFPFLFFAHRFTEPEARKIIVSFVSGCLFACLFNLARALYYYITQHVNYFYYSDFTHITHPSYFAMFLVMAVLLLILWYPQWFAGRKYHRLLIIALFVLFSFCIVISASKLGIISYILLVPSTLIYQQLQQKNYRRLGVLVVSIVGLLLISYCLFPQPFNRIRSAIQANSQEQIDKTSKESTVVRKLVWHEATEIIKQNTWIGVGPGDANDELYKAYERNGMSGALFKHLNAHNQYLQTFLGLGIAGFLLLCLMTLGTAIAGAILKNANLLLFSLLIIMNFLVESMLQTQAGTLFFVFFLCLFVQYNYHKPVTFQNQATL